MRVAGSHLRYIDDRGNADASVEETVFNIVTSGFLPPDAIDLIARNISRARQLLEGSPKSVSMIFGPDGRVISDTLCDEKCIVYADIDLVKCAIPKQFQDVVGYCNRFERCDASVGYPGSSRDVCARSSCRAPR